MHAVDSNVLVRLITRDDPTQAARADEFVASGAWVSHLVLAEMTWVLSAVYQLNAARIATALEMLLDHRTLSVQEADIVREALLHFRKKPSLGFSDCLIVEVARAAGHVPLGTFDKGLGKLPSAQRL